MRLDFLFSPLSSLSLQQDFHCCIVTTKIYETKPNYNVYTHVLLLVSTRAKLKQNMKDPSFRNSTAKSIFKTSSNYLYYVIKYSVIDVSECMTKRHFFLKIFKEKYHMQKSVQHIRRYIGFFKESYEIRCLGPLNIGVINACIVLQNLGWLFFYIYARTRVWSKKVKCLQIEYFCHGQVTPPNFRVCARQKKET